MKQVQMKENFDILLSAIISITDLQGNSVDYNTL